VEERIQYPRVTSMPLEPRAVAARLDEASGTLTMWAGHQMPYGLRHTVAAFLGVPAESVRVIVPDTGGGFGPKISVYPEDVLVAVLAARLRTPIKWIQTRSEFMVSTQHARDQIHYVRLAARRDGTLLGLQIRPASARHRLRPRLPAELRRRVLAPVSPACQRPCPAARRRATVWARWRRRGRRRERE
jgi:carbon-monoxide dehydrogenase large subunit